MKFIDKDLKAVQEARVLMEGRPKQRKHWLFLNRRNWTGSQPA